MSHALFSLSNILGDIVSPDISAHTATKITCYIPCKLFSFVSFKLNARAENTISDPLHHADVFLFQHVPGFHKSSCENTIQELSQSCWNDFRGTSLLFNHFLFAEYGSLTALWGIPMIDSFCFRQLFSLSRLIIYVVSLEMISNNLLHVINVAPKDCLC